MAKDANYVNVLLGENPSGVVVPLKVSSTGELVVQFIINGASPTGTSRVKRDANYVPVNSAQFNNDVYAIHTSTEGYVLVDGLNIS